MTLYLSERAAQEREMRYRLADVEAALEIALDALRSIEDATTLEAAQKIAAAAAVIAAKESGW
jgi:hypothetical protein